MTTDPSASGSNESSQFEEVVFQSDRMIAAFNQDNPIRFADYDTYWQEMDDNRVAQDNPYAHYIDEDLLQFILWASTDGDAMDMRLATTFFQDPITIADIYHLHNILDAFGSMDDFLAYFGHDSVTALSDSFDWQCIEHNDSKLAILFSLAAHVNFLHQQLDVTGQHGLPRTVDDTIDYHALRVLCLNARGHSGIPKLSSHFARNFRFMKRMIRTCSDHLKSVAQAKELQRRTDGIIPFPPLPHTPRASLPTPSPRRLWGTGGG